MVLSPGAEFGAYTIVAAIGAGGMGEVYRARDTRLKRDVALKILPESFTNDRDRVARFQREAELLAALNHSNIAQIYGVEDSGGARALILELIDGSTLADRIREGPLALEEAVSIARQIASALEAAHACGIVHRDLKPANIKVRPDGTVKVLDFGLAKAVGGAEVPGSSDVETVTSTGTRAGTISGTAPYMSPEQAKGLSVDRRTDIWAFGAVLYELLTGTAAFRGASVAETLSQVLTQPPNWDLLPANTPPPIRTLLRRALEKNPAGRLDSAVALRLELDDVLTSQPSVTTAGRARQARYGVAGVASVALVAGGLAAVLGTWVLMQGVTGQADRPVRFVIPFPPTEPLELSRRGHNMAISPDGRYLVYQSRNRLMIRAFDELDAVPLSGVTSGRTPFFSPDSRWVGFFEDGDLKKVAVAGEPVITLARNLGSPEGGTWGDDGTIVVSNEDGNVGLLRVPADGGEPVPLTRTTGAQNPHFSPSMLPGGRGVLFTIWANTPEERELAVLDLQSGQQKTLIRGGIAVEYVNVGYLVYATGGFQAPGEPTSATLWAVGFDLERLALRGEPVRISEALKVDLVSTANYVVSSTGTLVYIPARDNTRSFVWVDRQGRETPVPGLPPRAYVQIGLSPDGTRLSFSMEGPTSDIWVWEFEEEILNRLTSDSSSDSLPRWTPDGRRLIFRSDRDGPFNLYSVAADGSGQVERLTTSANDQYPNSVTPDGSMVLTCELRPATGFDILQFPAVIAPERRADPAMPPASASTTLVSTSSEEYSANISPDGRYFAYQSSESGRFAVYVKPYGRAGQARWQVSAEGGTAPVWARNGAELFYLDESNTLMAVPVDTSGQQFRHGRPARVFETTYSLDFYSYDVAPDGQRFLMMKQSAPGDRGRPTEVIVVLNWFEELKARMSIE